MVTIFPRIRTVAVGAAAAVVTAGVLASCSSYRSPEPIAASNPHVTYKYVGDQELMRAGQQASVFCSQYGGTAPRTLNITNNPDGSNTVTFECTRGVPPTTQSAGLVAPATPGLTYTYRTDHELLDATRSADAYACNPVSG